MFRLLVFSLFSVLFPSVSLAQVQLSKFVNPTTNFPEVNIRGFTPGQAVEVGFFGQTRKVAATCLGGSDRYALLTSDWDALTATLTGVYSDGVNNGDPFGPEPNLYGAEVGIVGGCRFFNGTRQFVTQNQQGQTVLAPPGDLGPIVITVSRFNPTTFEPIGKRSAWVRVQNWENNLVTLTGAIVPRTYKANNCGIVRFAANANSPLPDEFRLGATTYQVANLSTAYPPKCYKTGETSYTLFLPAN